MAKNRILNSVLFVFTSILFSIGQMPTSALADGDDRDQPRARPIVPAAAPVVIPAPEPVVVAAPQVIEEDCDCNGNIRLSGGVPVWFFNQESSNLPGAGAALDFWCDELPINFRVGVEGRHMYVGQSSADYAREFDDKTTRITYIRIPFSIEYMHALNETTTAYFGGGPDIIHTANDFSETNVGLHLSARVHYAFTKALGVSLEAGYMWGSVDGKGGRDVRFDNAFVSPMVAYTF